MKLDRRKFLKTTVAAGAALAIPGAARAAVARAAETKYEPLEFVFFTDTHIQPELNAGKGCEMCFAKIAASQPEFAIMGGDHVFDALGVGGMRAKLVFDLYARTQKALGMPIYQAIGNHDAFGVLTSSGIAPNDPLYGKKMYEDRFGKTYYSFDRKGYHFVVLDSIQPTPDRLWEAHIDDVQMEWLRADLKKLPAGAPVIGVVHCPLVTAFATYAELITAGRKYNTMTVANSPTVLDILAGANVLAVLQGHTHINENVEYKGTRYITSGAVCGNWWRGPRMGTPEGYSVVSIREGQVKVRYETYGFQSVAPTSGTASPSSMSTTAPAGAPAPPPK